MKSAITILVVEDDPAIRRLFRAGLTRAGYHIVEAGTAREALHALEIDKPEVVLLDLGLPDRDGLELIPFLRRQAAVIVVSARDATDQKVTALDLGADDFVSKPFDSEEVLARIRTAMRHRVSGMAEQPVVRLGNVEIDLVSRTVRKRDAPVHLTPKEYGFLSELARNPGRVITHAVLLRAVWGEGHENDVEYLRVAARGVRLKLEDDPANPAILRNEPGVGYRLSQG